MSILKIYMGLLLVIFFLNETGLYGQESNNIDVVQMQNQFMKLKGTWEGQGFLLRQQAELKETEKYDAQVVFNLSKEGDMNIWSHRSILTYIQPEEVGGICVKNEYFEGRFTLFDYFYDKFGLYYQYPSPEGNPAQFIFIDELSFKVLGESYETQYKLNENKNELSYFSVENQFLLIIKVGSKE